MVGGYGYEKVFDSFACGRCRPGFLFLPAQNSSHGYYWSSTELDINRAWYFHFTSSGGHNINRDYRTFECAVRPFQN